MNKYLSKDTLAIIFKYKHLFEIYDAKLNLWREKIEEWSNEVDNLHELLDSLLDQIDLWRTTTGAEKIWMSVRFEDNYGFTLNYANDSADQWVTKLDRTVDSIFSLRVMAFMEQAQPEPWRVRKFALQLRDLSAQLRGLQQATIVDG